MPRSVQVGVALARLADEHSDEPVSGAARHGPHGRGAVGDRETGVHDGGAGIGLVEQPDDETVVLVAVAVQVAPLGALVLREEGQALVGGEHGGFERVGDVRAQQTRRDERRKGRRVQQIGLAGKQTAGGDVLEVEAVVGREQLVRGRRVQGRDEAGEPAHRHEQDEVVRQAIEVPVAAVEVLVHDQVRGVARQLEAVRGDARQGLAGPAHEHGHAVHRVPVAVHVPPRGAGGRLAREVHGQVAARHDRRGEGGAVEAAVGNEGETPTVVVVEQVEDVNLFASGERQGANQDRGRGHGGAPGQLAGRHRVVRRCEGGGRLGSAPSRGETPNREAYPIRSHQDQARGPRCRRPRRHPAWRPPSRPTPSPAALAEALEAPRKGVRRSPGPRRDRRGVVGDEGFEPPTSSL